MTDTYQLSAHDAGRAGRPISAATRRRRLRRHYLAKFGDISLIDAASIERIHAAIELTCMAAEQRAAVTKRGSAASADDLLAIVRLENAASRAVARLEVPTSINTVADVAA